MKILFICVENACRSQMAEGVFNHLAKGEHEAFSAGISTAEEVNPLAVKVMEEIGIDISDQKPKLIDLEMVTDMDKVISMGCIDKCPSVKIDEDWEIKDPKGKGIEKFRQAREMIYQKVKESIQRLDNEKN